MWKELHAMRHTIELFLSQLKGRNILHEDNTAKVATLTMLSSRSPFMMKEVRNH
jgi:hypothetical protein